MSNEQLEIGKWYIYERGKGTEKSKDNDSCKRCQNGSNKPFLARSTLPAIPFHPNCRCTVRSYQAEMISSFKKVFPGISNITLDALLAKDYYKHREVARPTYVDGNYHYYRVGEDVYKVNMATLHGLGILPSGQYIVGQLQEAENRQFLEDILSHKAEPNEQVIGITEPLRPEFTIGATKSPVRFQSGERKTFRYFGQIYHGQLKGNGLYLDDTCQRAFLQQLGLWSLPWRDNQYMGLSVSELVRLAGVLRKGYKPYDPSKPLPTLNDTITEMIRDTTLMGKDGITDAIPLSATMTPDGKSLRIRCVSSLEPGAVTVTDYLIVTKTKRDWILGTRGFYDFLMDATNLLSVAAEVNDPTLLIGGAVVTVPLALIGQGAGVINNIGTMFPPQAVRRLDEALRSVKDNDTNVQLLAYVEGHNASFDKQGNLTFLYSYKYSIL